MATSSQFLLACFLVVAGVLLADPFQLSPIAKVDFTPNDNPDLPPPLVDFPSDDAVKLTAAEVKFKDEVYGPESLAFDPNGEGPYTGLGDGRVVKWTGESSGWITFTTTSPHRTSNCTLEKPGPNLPMEHICGRPLGLRFNKQTGDLYIADAYFGLFVVGKEGGQARLVATEAEGVPFGFTNDIDIDNDGVIYFTDTSTKYRRRHFLLEILEGEPHGRLLKHDLKTGKTAVLLKGLNFPNGVALSADQSFLVFCETSLVRVQRYWLKGEKAGTIETFRQLPGWPDNIRLNPRGHFWVGVHARRSAKFDFLAKRPWLRTLILRLPISIKAVYALVIGLPHGIIVELDKDGNVTQVLEDKQGLAVKAASEVEEKDGKLWIGSVVMPYIAVYKL